MKNLILLTTVFFSMNVLASATTPTVSEKALKTFNQVFKDAQNVTWCKVARYNAASFTMGGVKTRSLLDNRGNLVQTIRYYKAENLPANILYNVQKEYCYDVWGVTEVSNSNGTLYNVVLRCNKFWYHVKADANGNVELAKRYRRGDI